MIEIEVQAEVQTIALSRPEKKNALTSDMYTKMANAIQTARFDDAIRATVIKSTSADFTAGNDIAEFQRALKGQGDFFAPLSEFLRALVFRGKPIVAAVDGLAIGLGTTMLFHCDYVLATERASFRTPFVQLGLLPEAASTLLAPNTIGPKASFELLALGQKITSKRAAELGLVTRLVAPEALDAETHTIVTEMLSLPPQSLALTHAALLGERETLWTTVERELEQFKQKLNSAEARAAFSAFGKK